MNKAIKNQIKELKNLINIAQDHVGLGSQSALFKVGKVKRAIWKLEEMSENAEQVKEAYIDEYGVYRWSSNNQVPFDDMLKCWTDDEFQLNACREARDKDADEFLSEYREKIENHVPDAEEMFEMKAAFGEGAEVVNVITGQVTKL